VINEIDKAREIAKLKKKNFSEFIVISNNLPLVLDKKFKIIFIKTRENVKLKVKKSTKIN